MGKFKWKLLKLPLPRKWKIQSKVAGDIPGDNAEINGRRRMRWIEVSLVVNVTLYSMFPLGLNRKQKNLEEWQ
jgi:hypothetical protein